MNGLQIVYVGKGTGWRFLHPNSGRSSCIELNKDHFNNIVFDVYLLKHGMTHTDALKLEEEAIMEFVPLYNKVSGLPSTYEKRSRDNKQFCVGNV